MDIRNFRIGARLTAGFGLVLLMLIAVVAINFLASTRERAMLRDDIGAVGVKVQLANAMRTALLEEAVAMRNIGLAQDVPQMQAEEARMAKLRKQYRDAMQALLAMGVGERENAILKEIDRTEPQLIAAVREALGHAMAFDPESAAKILATKVEPLSDNTLTQIQRLAELEEARSRDAIVEATAFSKRTLILVLGLGLGALVGGALCAWLTARSITRPMGEAVRIAQTVAAGDLSSTITVRGRDESAQLLQALQDMNAALVRIVGEVRGGTELIAAASSEIATGNADLSSRTESQASSLEETASSMEELTSTVKLNTENARQANLLAHSASEVARKGGAVVSDVVKTMGAINASSRKIVDIISVIDGIAFQTNILALNAAVEAARAGEQGRGFAVVASEVRNLAQRSAGAAKEIKLLISDSVDKVRVGSQLVDQAGATMDEVVQSIARVTDIMADISAASQEQTAGIEQINQAIIQMDDATQQNAALVEQAAAASESLRNQADKLAQAVSVFKLSAQPGVERVALRDARVTARPAAPARVAALRPPSSGLVRPRQAGTELRQPARLANVGGDWEESEHMGRW